MVKDPGEAAATLPLTVSPVLTSIHPTMSSFSSRRFRGSFPSSFRLTACLLAVLRLKLYVTAKPPKTRYPVDGLPSGAGFAPAGLHDLARPHWMLNVEHPTLNIQHRMKDNSILYAEFAKYFLAMRKC